MNDKAKELGKRPAFPDEFRDGMNLRQYFAGLAMQGLLANHSHLDNIEAVDFAITGVRCADALLEELSKS